MARDKISNDVGSAIADYNETREEGTVAKTIESQTSKLPSDIFLWAGVGAMATALTLKLLKKDNIGLFFGQWAAPLLLFGLYNKLVKLEGHDQTNQKPD
jgi:hypothetical protein